MWYSHGSHYDLVYHHAEFEALNICQNILLTLVDLLFGSGAQVEEVTLSLLITHSLVMRLF